MSFNVTGYSGLVFDIDAENTASMFLDNAFGGGNPSATGDEVKSVEAGTYDFIQVGTARGPRFQLNETPGGANSLDFPADALLGSAAASVLMHNSQEFTIIAAVKAESVTAYMLCWGDKDVTNNYGYWNIRVAALNPDGQRCYRRYTDGAGAEDLVDIGSSYAVISLDFTATGTRTRCYTNTNSGTDALSGSGSTAVDLMTVGGLVRSSSPNGELLADIKIGRIVGFNVKLSDANRLEIINGIAADVIGAPATPTSPVATATYKGVFLTWAISTGATSYIIERSANGSTGWTTVGTTTSKLYYADTSLAVSTLYYYRISASNFAGTSAATANVSATTLSTLTSPAHVCPCYEWWKSEDLPAGSIGTWTGNINARALTQGTAGNKPTRAANGSGTASYLAQFDGTDDYLIYDAGGSVFQNDFTIAMALKLGSGASRTANENYFIACKSGTNNQTLDLFARRGSGCSVHSDCRLNDGTSQYSFGAYVIDTTMHLVGMCSNTDGYGKLWQDGTLSKQQRLRVSGGALTFDMFTIGAHRRVSIDSYCKGDFGDIVLYQYELNADQWGYLDELLRPRFGTTAGAVADPINITENLVAGNWAAAIADAAGGAPADGTSLGNNYQWAPTVGYLCEMTNSTSAATFETSEAPNGLPAVAVGASGLFVENPSGTIAGKVTGGGAFTWMFMTRPKTISGSAQSFGSLTNNGASNAYLTARVNASGAYELASRDNSNNDYSASGGVADNLFHTHIITYNGNQTVKWYVDGVLTVTMTTSASTVWTFSRYVMGGLYRGSLTEGFTDLRIFEHRLVAALITDANITSLVSYAQGRYGTNVMPQFDAASNSGYQAASASYSWNHTCAGSDRYLVVGISMLSLAQTVSGITYNGVALTLLGTRNSVSGAARVELWGLVAPALGVRSIAVTLTGAIASSGNASSYSGVHQTSYTEAFSSAQASNVGAADATVSVTTVTDGAWVVDTVATDDTAITVGTGQTSRGNVTGAGGSGAMSSEGPKTPAGAVTMSWTDVGAAATWVVAGIGLRPVTAAGAVNYANLERGVRGQSRGLYSGR